jgi:hypothetical protein
MEEKIESEKSKMENKIHSSQRKENAVFRGGVNMMGTSLEDEVAGWKSKVKNRK